MSKWLGLLIVIAIGGCDKQLKSGQPDAATDSSGQPPRALLFQQPRLPGPGGKVEGGLVFAVWDSGVLIRRSSNDEAKEPYIRGRLDRKSMARLRRAADELIDSISPDSRIHVDGGGYVVITRRANVRNKRELPALRGEAASAIQAIEELVSSLPLTETEPYSLPAGALQSWLER